MTKLELTDEESQVLVETLELSVMDLQSEVTHTDSYDFKEQLKRKRAVLDRVLGKARGEPQPA